MNAEKGLGGKGFLATKLKKRVKEEEQLVKAFSFHQFSLSYAFSCHQKLKSC